MIDSSPPAVTPRTLTRSQRILRELGRRLVEQQILGSLERLLSGTIQEFERAILPATTKEVNAWQKAYDAGQMPPLGPLEIASGFDTGLWSAMLQSGGLDVLDVRSTFHRLQQFSVLSTQMIRPNIGDSATFYDEKTKKLRPQFDWYPQALQTALEEFQRIHKACKRVQARVARTRSHG